SLYVYGKKGPQKPEISDSDDKSIEHSTCQSNDSEGSFGNPSEHSFKSESESISIPNDMSTFKSVTTNEKVVSKTKEVEPSCATHVKTPRQQMKNQGTPTGKGKNWNKIMERELGEGYSFIKKKCFVCGSLSHLIKDCDFYEKKMAREAELIKQRVFNTGNGVAKPVWNNANRVNRANHFIPRPVQLNTDRQNDNSVRPNVKTGRANVNSVRQNVNSVRTNVNTGRSKQPVPTSNSNSFSPGNWGTAVKTSAGSSTQERGGQRYREQRFSWVFFLATKDETSGILQNFIRQIENQLNHRVKIIRSDNGTEFKNRDMLEFCGNKGIKQEYSNARTPQQNGVAERMNRTLIEAARTMLADSLLPTTFWAEAVSTACYIFNRKEAYSTGISEDTPEIQAFRKELDELAQNHLREVPKNKATSTNSVNFSSRQDNTQPADQDDSDMPELTIVNTPQKGIFDEASYDDEGMVHDFNNLQQIAISPIPTLGNPTFIHKVNTGFQMSSMGELIFFLGLQVKQKTDGIFISQDKYVADMLKKFDLASVKTAITPMETKMALTKDEEADEVDVHLYRSMIGSLMYLTASRPDIMFAVCACSRFQVTPKTSHLNAVKRIFKYLKGKPNLGLWYPRESSLDLEAFSDSDYAGANLDRKSTTGGCQFLGSRLISWQCKKQTIVATSTTEAEYVAAASCCGQVLWIQNQMLDYGFNFMNTKIHIDNESTICIVKNPVYHSKTKHIEIRHHFIRDSYEKKLIRVEKIHTDFNVADLLTKAFDGPRLYLDCMKDWSMTEVVKKLILTTTASTLADGTLELRATIDTLEYTITKASVRSKLQLADASGISMLPNTEIFERMGNMGYPTDVPPPPTSQPTPTESTTIPPTPVTEPTSEPPSPSTAPEHETMEHPFEQPSPEHQLSSPRQESDILQTQAPTHTHEAKIGHMSVDDLFQLVPQLMTRIESLEKDLKQTKQTMGNAIVKLVKKVKKMEKVVKSRRVVLTDSDDEAAENSSKQGRNLQKDESEVFETPKQGKSSGETDISPQGLEAVETLVEVLSQIKTKRRNVKTGVRRRLDAEGVSTGFKDVSTGFIDIKSASEKVSSGGEHVSPVEILFFEFPF
ncbi:putative ribonuclease H-like domain-containing protein, partial [Tanacetum coccineum]